MGRFSRALILSRPRISSDLIFEVYGWVAATSSSKSDRVLHFMRHLGHGFDATAL